MFSLFSFIIRLAKVAVSPDLSGARPVSAHPDTLDNSSDTTAVWCISDENDM